MDTEADIERAAINLVRFAHTCRASGKAIKREDLREHVLQNTGTRQFKQVFETANAYLKEDFGLQMVSLPQHEKRTGSSAATNGTKAANRWVLQSVLPDQARQQVDMVQTTEEREILGFAATVLSLIFVNNMCLSHEQLVMYVRKLGPPQYVLPSDESRESISGGYATDAQMESAAQAAVAYLVRTSYIDKLAPQNNALHSLANTQATQSAGGEEADSGQEYTWGPQAKVMFQPMDMARFIASVTGQECTPEFIKAIGRAYGQNIESV
ncbi:hypothetical protein LPJ55_000536 [Coemansia sp. RSA 990]|nr:MAGE family-domain-containing protein [Coemansia mojavensis]KAJ1748882.1 hypothetical protein LPJ79_004167 [Coemansia sp. RSA 1821]KAJ1875543.1 hypothetical protein LPJ55_000536 [Coemansia sp. RSA 990]KAJ2673173.1 hypothetical protein IWW42_002458 [Coemansia sp. RSA 1085]